MKKMNMIMLIIAGFTTMANAQNAPSSDMKVSAKVISGCLLEAGDVNFGALEEKNRTKTHALMSNTDIAFSQLVDVKVKCSNNTPYTLGGPPMKQGKILKTDWGQYMIGETHKQELQYASWIYSGTKKGYWFSTGQTFFGNGTGSGTSSTIPATGNGQWQTHTIFFGIYSPTSSTGSLKIVPDNYSDTFVYTVTY